MARNGTFAAFPDGRSGLRNPIVVLCGFFAVLCCWIGMAGYLMVGGPTSGLAGLLIFGAVPVAATAGTFLLARRHRASSPSAVSAGLKGRPPRSVPRPGRPATRGFLVIGGFTTALLWWIGIAAYAAVGGVPSGIAGLTVFLGVPALASVATYLAVRRRRVG
ncbi:hypothetical protein AB4Y86_12565 [Arthrobacter sp. 2YAF22_2]|uniref:hypothetical protein n=1 Tax=Arthrobacter sp. 2YAF22_2 TaxID=3233029 RepID=UPI003F8FB6F6